MDATLPVQLCTRCGLVRARATERCGGCDQPAPAGDRPDPEKELVWAAVFAQFVCRACGEATPIDDLDPRLRVLCDACGQTQLLSAKTISDALERAWELADHAMRAPLSMDDPEGLLLGADALAAFGRTTHAVPFEDEGIERADVDRSRTLRFRLTAGVPSCGTCRRPLTIDAGGSGVRASCAPCGTTEVYARPRSELDISPMPLAVLSTELRSDLALATVVEGDGGVSALKCPSCGAALESVDAHGRSRCGYCKSLVRVERERARRLARVASERADPLWVAFRGPSPTRGRLTSRAQSRRDRARNQETKARKPPTEQPQRQRQPPRTPEAPKPEATVPWVGMVLILAITGVGVAVVERVDPAPDDETPALSVPPPAPPPPPAPQPVATMREFPAACGCPAAETGGAPAFTWRFDIASTMSFGDDFTQDGAYVWVAGTRETPVLASDQTAPPSPIRVERLVLAVACEDEAFVVSDGRYTTRWSRAEGRMLASAATPSPLAPLPPTDEPTVECVVASVENGALVFTDPGGVGHRIPLVPELLPHGRRTRRTGRR